MEHALAVAEQRVQQQAAEIEELEREMERETERESVASARLAAARAVAAAVADGAVAGVVAAAAAEPAEPGASTAEAPVRLELERLRAQKRERGKRHADASRRRRDGVGTGQARLPLECWRENGVAVPAATYAATAVPAVEKKRYEAEKRRFVSERAPIDRAFKLEQRENRHIMQGKGSTAFLECRTWVRALRLRSFPEWLAFNSSGARPAHIPADPHRRFLSEGWLSYEDWLGYTLHDAQQEEAVETSRAAAWEEPSMHPRAPDPPLLSSLAVEGQGGPASSAHDDAVAEAEQVPMFAHQHHGIDGGWRGWTEARRFATQLGLSRSYLAQLAKDNPKVTAILELSPGVQRFLSDANPMVAELQECLRHMPQRSLATAYRHWATAGHGENELPVASRPADIPVHPEQVYQGWAGPWLTWNDWLGLPAAAVAPAHGNEQFLEFRVARKAVRSLSIPSQKAWLEFITAGAQPGGVPPNPAIVYARTGWRSWSDWLGCERGWC